MPAVRYATLSLKPGGKQQSRTAALRGILLWMILLLSTIGCVPSVDHEKLANIEGSSWQQILDAARGTTVHLTMWQGDPLINAYIQDYVVPSVRDSFGIELKIASGQGGFIVQSLMAEMQAGKETSAIDLVWINGETFYQLRQINALYGPWVRRLPNARYIDFENPFIGMDFQQPVNGFECPWGNVQMAIIYNSAFVKDPPKTRADLLAFVQNNPGKFTMDNHFTGLTFLKGLLIDIAGGKEVLSGPFDEEKYQNYSAELWAFMGKLRPFLWRDGNAFPENVAQMHQLFANGELWFTMSNNDSEVDNKISQGLFTEDAKAYVPDFGTIRNTHYMGIPARSANKPGAMVIANFLISPAAQLKKANPVTWGDGTVLSMNRLPEIWQQRFNSIPERKNAPSREEMRPYALMELAPAYMIRLAEDFQSFIIHPDER